VSEQLRVTLPSSGISDVGATSAIRLLEGMYRLYPGWRATKIIRKSRYGTGNSNVGFFLHTEVWTSGRTNPSKDSTWICELSKIS